MDLSVVLLSYNTRDLLEQALRTVVEAATELEAEIFVVDNASHDGSADMVAARFPQVKLIRNKENIGFAAGNNIAFEQVRGGQGEHVKHLAVGVGYVSQIVAADLAMRAPLDDDGAVIFSAGMRYFLP